MARLYYSPQPYSTATNVGGVSALDYGAVPARYFADGVANTAAVPTGGGSAGTKFTSATAAFTAGDVGKGIRIQRAGTNTNRPFTTTISAVVSATEVTLASPVLRNNATAKFHYGPNATTALQAAIDASLGSVSVPGYFFHTGLTLRNGSVLQGAGYGVQGGGLLLLPGSNKPNIATDMTSGSSPQRVVVRNLLIDGNRPGQTSWTTTLASNFTIGDPTMHLSAAPLLPSGTLILTGGGNTERIYYSAVSGNDVTILASGREGTTKRNWTTGLPTTVTQINSHGVYLSLNPYVSEAALDEDTDPYWLLENLLITEVAGWFVEMWGFSQSYLHNVNGYFSGDGGFRPTFDTFLHRCDAAWSGRIGFFLNSAHQLTNCKAWYSGELTVGTPADGHGFYYQPLASQPDAGVVMLSGCFAQDNYGSGLVINQGDRLNASLTLDSNSQIRTGSVPAIQLVSGTMSDIRAVCTERGKGPSSSISKTITNAVNNGSGLIRITATSHGFATNAVVQIAGVVGTTEANKSGWTITVIDSNTFDLVGSAFVNAYTSGGTVRYAGQKNALSVDAGSYGNIINLSHEASNNMTYVDTALTTTSDLSGGHNIRIREGSTAYLRGGRPRDIFQANAQALGLVSYNWPPHMQASTNTVTSQVIYAMGQGLSLGTTVTGISLWTAIAAGGTNPTNAYVALLDSTGKVLAKSADLKADAGWTAAAGIQTFSLGSTYTVPVDGLYYAAFLVNGTWGTTQPTFYRAAGGPVNVKLSAAQTGQTAFAAVGSSQTLATGSSLNFWAGVAGSC